MLLEFGLFNYSLVREAFSTVVLIVSFEGDERFKERMPGMLGTCGGGNGSCTILIIFENMEELITIWYINSVNFLLPERKLNVS